MKMRLGRAKGIQLAPFFPDNLGYDGEVYRTPLVNEAGELVFLKNKGFRTKKMGQKSLEKILSHEGVDCRAYFRTSL